MRRYIVLIGHIMSVVPLLALNDTIAIPLTMKVFQLAPQDSPTGSTPDPTDPNQFRASLVGNTLLIETQAGQVSYVVIQESESNSKKEDYFFELSYGSVSCPITHAGLYSIYIGYWNTDFIAHLRVERVNLYDLNGHLLTERMPYNTPLPAGMYILRVETTIGTTTIKFYQQP